MKLNQSERIDPLTILTLLNIAGSLAGIMSLGLTISGFANRSKAKNETLNHHVVQNMEEVRKDLRDILEGLEDYIALIQKVEADTGQNYLGDKFDANVHIVFTRQEMLRYIEIKESIDRKISSSTIRLNAILKLVVNHQPSEANVFIEFTEDIQKTLNLILLENTSIKEASDALAKSLNLVVDTLNNKRLNRY